MSPRPGRAALRRALFLINRYSLDITDIARGSLEVTANSGIAALLRIHAEPGVTSGELAAHLGQTRAATSRLLTTLVGAGLVERRADPHDGRRVHLHLTRRASVRVRTFEARLGAYLLAASAAAKDVLEELGSSQPRSDAPRPTPPLECAAAMAVVGARFVAEIEAEPDLRGVAGALDRYALVLLAELGEVRPTQMAEHLLLSRSGATDLLDRLVDGGLVERHHDRVAEDHRVVVTTLTAAGQRAVDALLDVTRRRRADLARVFALTLALDPAP